MLTSTLLVILSPPEPALGGSGGFLSFLSLTCLSSEEKSQKDRVLTASKATWMLMSLCHSIRH